MNDQSQSIEPHHTHLDHNELTAPPSPPSAAFIEKFLHHQEDAGMSSGEFQLGLFRIDSANEDEADGAAASSLELEECSLHPSDECERDSSSCCRDNWRGSLPLYTTSVDVDFAEAAIVAPIDLEEGNILRVDMGMRRILVAQVPEGGVKCGETFKAPYQIHHTPMSDLEAFRHKAYNDGHYHGWVTKLFGCYEKGTECYSGIGAACCPCFLLSTVMSRMHLNWYGKHTSSVSSSAQKRSQHCTTACIVVLYTSAFALTVLLILHIVRAIYCLEYDHIFHSNLEEPIGREEEAAEIIELGTLDEDITCNYKINKAYLSSIVGMDALLCGYIILLMSRARTAIREHHYIYGGPIEDCCVSCCCNCCTLSQLAKETSYEDHETRRLSNVDVSIGEPGEFLNENNREGQHSYRPIV